MTSLMTVHCQYCGLFSDKPVSLPETMTDKKNKTRSSSSTEEEEGTDLYCSSTRTTLGGWVGCVCVEGGRVKRQGCQSVYKDSGDG